MSIKIIDCFIFYNELDLLTYRLNVLNDFVDYFVIVESRHTFVGKEKKLYFNENKHLFENFNKKIIHIIVDDFPYKHHNISITSNEQWSNETFQRNAISIGINCIKDLSNSDLIIISDLDEIPDPYTLDKIKKNDIIVDINALQMDLYYYNLNTKVQKKWNLSKIVSYKNYIELNKSCNDIRNMECHKISNGGWHLSYFGDAKFIKNKINSFSHQELNNDNYTDLLKIEENIKKNRDLYGREDINIEKVEIKDNKYLPVNYDIYMKKYINHISNYNYADCTLVTCCYDTSKFNSHALSPEKILKRIDVVLQLPVYLIIFTDKEFKDHILEARKTLGFGDITHIIVQELKEIWCFNYLEKVKKNREIYFPTRDDRTSAESHIITCNKFDFVLQGITLNPFNTTKFGWIDSFLSNEAGNGLRICEDYTLDKFLYVINNITEKFHIQILNVNDKKYKNESLKHDYYSCYRYVVCGGFFTCGIEIGVKILSRLKEIFVKTTELGYGHGEEMLYLEILDEFYDDIEKGYGDYGQIINNILYPTKNLHYVLHLIVYNYLNYGYYRECYDCCKKIIYSIEQLSMPVDNNFYVNVLLSYLIATYYYKKDEALQVLNKIDTIVTTNNEIKLVYDNLKNNYNGIIETVNSLKQNYDLIFCVFGCATKEAYKNQILKINETWGKDVYNYTNAKLLFFLGEEKTDLIDNNRYVYLENVDNDYLSASYKQNLGLKYIYENFNFNYVFICGTDTFINIPKIVDYVCSISDDKLYIGPGGDYKYVENRNYFFQSGSGFILTKSCIQYLYPTLHEITEQWIDVCNKSNVTHLIPGCDVAIGYYLQKDDFIKEENILIDEELFLIHNFRGKCNYIDNNSLTLKNENEVNINKIITCHFMNLQDFDDFYDLLQKNNYFIEPKHEVHPKYNYICSKYKKLCTIQSDINEHLPTLYEYASKCESILELGVRGVISSWAFLNGLINNNKNKKELFLNDIESCHINELLKYSKNTNVVIEYEWIDDLKLEFDDNRTFDMVFIDTWHVYAQLKRELEKYSKITNKYIIMHDTEVDAIFGETVRNSWNANEQSEITGFSVDEINCGLNKAVYNFLYENKNWRMLKHYVNNNGLTILEKIS
jgi:beta-1,4-mannosyl-glycoprotein beta-1,4-N-acetylglucosaminyltransferase